MKKRITTLLALTLLVFQGAMAQGNWVVADQNVSPSTSVSANGTLSISGSYTWVSTTSFENDRYLAELVYALPPSLYSSTGTPALTFANNTPVPGVTFTHTGEAWKCSFAPGTVFAPGTKVIFSIDDIDIKDDMSYTNQQLTHFISFVASPAMESFTDNAATITFNSMSNAPLPVGLLQFDARLVSREVQLNWTTTSEINADYFMVQRSRTASDWEDVMQVAAKGKQNAMTDYEAVDASPLMGKSYYRLKQVDDDNNYAYSDVRVIDIDANAFIKVYPNPATNYVNIEYTLDEESLIEVKLMTADGRVAKSVMLNAKSGTQTVEVDVRELANGLYTVNLYKNTALLYTNKFQKK